MILKWEDSSNLEQSLYDFLVESITTNNVQVLDDTGTPKTLNVRVGEIFNTEWGLPTIQIYHDSNPSMPRLEIGSDRRDTRFLIIIDVRANNPTNRKNIADWITTVINTGFAFYEYTPNGTTPTKVQNGHVDFDFLFNGKVNLGDDVSIYDKYRHRISINCWIQRH